MLFRFWHIVCRTFKLPDKIPTTEEFQKKIQKDREKLARTFWRRHD